MNNLNVLAYPNEQTGNQSCVKGVFKGGCLA